MTKTLVEEYVEDPSHMRLFQQERAIYEITELLENVMKQEGVSRAELAKRLGKSKGWVTQLLDGEGNKTLRTVADVLAVLGRELHASAKPIRIGSLADQVISKKSLNSGTSPRRKRRIATARA